MKKARYKRVTRKRNENTHTHTHTHPWMLISTRSNPGRISEKLKKKDYSKKKLKKA